MITLQKPQLPLTSWQEGPTSILVSWTPQEGPTSILVSWTPLTPLEDTTGYKIYYRGDSSGIVDVSISTQNHSLTGLKNGTIYTLSIVGIS